MQIITFEQRRKQIHSNDDLEKQITLSGSYAKRIRTEAKKCGTLAEKIEMNKAHKQALDVHFQLKMRYFDIQNELVC